MLAIHAATAPSEPTKHTTQPIVTGTTVIGIKYNGGVMLAADTLASYGSLARYKDVRRLQKVGDNTLIGASHPNIIFLFQLIVIVEQLCVDCKKQMVCHVR